MKTFEQTWRWFGPDDPVTLTDIHQAGATGIVTALHHIPNGEIWSAEEIKQRLTIIEAAGFSWSVVESVPVHEAIKLQLPGFEKYLDNYCRTLQNLGEQGIHTVCYNFMPVIDWTRTSLQHRNPDGSISLHFDPVACLAFELFILKREEACDRYPGHLVDQAQQYYQSLDKNQLAELERGILAGLPGAEESYSLDRFRAALNAYKELDDRIYRSHLATFLKRIVPVAEQAGIRMAIHPDDPPMPLFGLPRIVSTHEDLKTILQLVNSPANGITFCTGSLGSRRDNHLPNMTQELAGRINFVHLRNVHHTSEGCFTEVNHLAGDIDIYSIMKSLIIHQHETNRRIPMRPDHGLRILDDLKKDTNPGYPAIGRLKGLAEIRGMGTAIEKGLGY